MLEDEELEEEAAEAPAYRMAVQHRLGVGLGLGLGFGLGLGLERSPANLAQDEAELPQLLGRCVSAREQGAACRVRRL